MVYVLLNGAFAARLDLLATSEAFSNAAVGHRGAGYLWPENTLVALRAAAAAGLSASEVDVRLTRDTVPVLLHDSFLERTTTGQGNVESLTLDQVASVDAGIRFAQRFAGERVPTLRQALEFAQAARHPLVLDVKNDQRVISPEEEAALILSLVREANAEDLVTLLSPDRAFLRAARAGSERVRLAVLVGSRYYPHHLRIVDESRANVIMYPPDSLLHPHTIAALDSFSVRGVRLAASTLNDPRLADSLIAYGRATQILTGYPPRTFDLLP